MKHRLVTTLLVVTAVVVATLTSVTTTDRPAQAAAGASWPIDTYGLPRSTDNVVLKWNEQFLETIRKNAPTTGPTVTARALGVVHTAMYDAWAAYDPVAIGTRLGGSLRRPAAEFTLKNKSEAISYAAYKTLLFLFPDGQYHRKSAYDAQMAALGYAIDGSNASPAAMVGNAAAQAVIDYRQSDGSNQVNGYTDTTGYTAKNTWDKITIQRYWQPLCVLTPAGVEAWKADNSLPLLSPPECVSPNYAIQKPLHPQWQNVLPFGPLKKSNHYPYMLMVRGSCLE